jgi:hypothetical protein
MRVRFVIPHLLAGAFVACAPGATAGMSPDPTGLWYDPDESGWGLSLVQQGDIVFAALLVYDESHRAAWYAAPAMQPSTLFVPGGAQSTSDASGVLYRTSGPWFGAPFDRTQVSAAPVGQMRVTYTGADGQALSVTYTIDGRDVAKTVRPQTWSGNRARLEGAYAGGLYVPAHTGDCPPIDVMGARTSTLQVQPNAQPDGVRITWGTGIDTVCLLEGAYAQSGQLGALTGTLMCGPVAGVMPMGAVRVTGMQVSEHGFAGLATLSRDGCTYRGHFGGVATN